MSITQPLSGTLLGPIATEAEAAAGTANDKIMTPLRVSEYAAAHFSIGGAVQAYNEGLQQISDLTAANDDLMQYKAGSWANRTLAQVMEDMGLSLISNERISVNTSDVTSRVNIQTSAGDGTSASGLYVAHYNAAAGAYGIESRVYPGCFGNVTHHYSDAGPAWQMDNVGTQSILTLVNAANEAVRPGVKGTGSFINFVGYGSTTPNTRTTLGYISPALQFASNEAGNQWTFVNGVALLAGSGEANRALTVTSLNSGYNSTFYGNIYGPYMATDSNGGAALTVAKTATGTGTAATLINLGTGETIYMSNASGRTAGFASNGYLGIGTVGGTYGIAILLATVNTALFASSGSNAAQVRIDTSSTGQKAVTILGSGFSTKWTYGKDTDDSFYIQQNAGAKVFEVSAASVVTLKSTDASTFVSATSTGVLTLGASGKAVTLGSGAGAVQIGGSAAAVTIGAGNGTVQVGNGSGAVTIGGATSAVTVNASGGTLGFFGATPVTKPTLPAIATDLPTALTLLNAMRAADISYGLAA